MSLIVQVKRAVIGVDKLAIRGYHVLLRCGHLLIRATPPSAVKLRCWACEYAATDIKTASPKMTDAQAIARLDYLNKIPIKERGAYHTTP